MTRLELEAKIKDLGLTYSHHQAMSGSQYITIDGEKYRVSDHEQPSHYQVRNYIDCSSHSEVLDHVMIGLNKKINTTDEYIWSDDVDGFINNPSYIG